MRIDVLQPARQDDISIRLALSIILVCAIIARLVMSQVAPGILWSDSLVYYREAVSILQQGDFRQHEIFHGPLFPSLLAFFLRIAENEQSGLLFITLQRLLGLLSGLLVFQIAQRYTSRKGSLVVALLTVLNPLLLYYESVVQTEVLFIFFLSLFSYAFLRTLDRGSELIDFACTGLLLGLCALTRPSAQLFLICLIPVLLFSQKNFAKTIKTFAVLALFYFLSVFPWMYVNHQVFGFWGVSKGQGINLFFRAIDQDRLSPSEEQLFPEVTEARQFASQRRATATTYFTVRSYLLHQKKMSHLETEQALFNYAWAAVKAHPLEFSAKTLRNFLILLYWPRTTSDVCSDSSGREYLCCRQTQGKSRLAFSNAPPESSGLIVRSAVRLYKSQFSLMPLIVSLAILGLVLSLLRCKYCPAEHLYFALLILYFGLTSVALNIYEDRFRLVFDWVLFLFAWLGCVQLLKLRKISNVTAGN